ncbi:MAG: DUF2127 domain-containing protein [Ignavibacteriota bacterium]
METREKDRSFVHRAFWLSLFIKGLDGALQLLGGIAVLVVAPGTLGKTYRYFTRFLVGNRTHNPEADFIREAAHSFHMSVAWLIAIYLLVNGIIKVLLVYGLLKEKMWVFPAALAGFSIFFSLEVWRLSIHFYWGIVIFMAISVFVITMVILEWRKVFLRSREAG